MTKVYFGKIREESEEKIKNAQRRSEIEKFTYREGKIERIFVWLLLEYAVKDTFGVELESLNPRKNENGKWECDKIYFSLSHSHGGAAVALSDGPVGVDIEKMPVRNAEKLVRALTKSERIYFENAENKDLAFASLWTKKECIYKKSGTGAFSPEHISANGEETQTGTVNIDNSAFCLSVTGKNAEYKEVTV